MIWLVPAIVGVVLLGLLLLVLMRRKKLPPAFKAQMQAAWAKLPQIQDPHRRILEAENILDAVFKKRGYQGTFADKLRAIGNDLPNVQSVWDAHKLRNRIAHEHGMTLSQHDIQQAMMAFERALHSLLR